MAGNEQLDTVLKELAETTNYLRETGRLLRQAVDRLEEHIEKSTRFLAQMSDHADKAINAALRVQERAQNEGEGEDL